MKPEVKRLSNSVIELFNTVVKHLKPTPMKVQYTFNHRDLMKMISGVAKVENTYLKD